MQRKRPMRFGGLRARTVKALTSATLYSRYLIDIMELKRKDNRAGPKGVSTKGVSMKRPNFPDFRAFYTVVSKGNFQKSP